MKKFVFKVGFSVIAILFINSLAAAQDQDIKEKPPTFKIKKKIIKLPKSILFPKNEQKLHVPKINEQNLINNKVKILDIKKNLKQEDNSAILVEELSEDLNAELGPLNINNGGFDADIWEGSEFNILAKEIDKLRPFTASPILRRLYRKILLTSAHLSKQTPLSKQNEGRKNFSTLFLNLRLAKIMQNGNLEDMKKISALLDAKSLNADDDILTLYFLTDQFAKACTGVSLTNSLKSSSSDLFERTNIICHAAEKNQEAVEIAFDMMIEAGKEDYNFFNLARRFMEDQKFDEKSEPLNVKLSALNVFLLMKLNYIFKKSEIQIASHFILQKIALDHKQPDSIRAQAIEILSKNQEHYAAGLYAPALLKIYDSFSFNSQMISAILKQSNPSDALIYKAALNEENDYQRAQILNKGWVKEKPLSDFIIFARVNNKSIKRTVPSADLIPYAQNFILSLLHLEEFTQAQVWYDFLKLQSQKGNDNAEDVRVKLWSFMVILSQENVEIWNETELEKWWDSREGYSAASANSRMIEAAYFYALCRVFDYDVPLEMSQQTILRQELENSENLSVEIWQELLKLTKANRNQQKLGETVLFILNILQDIDFSKLDTLSMTSILKLLKHSGFEKEARALAFEALLAKGF